MTHRPYRIEWRPMAREDLRAIVLYISQNDPLRAKRFAQTLREKTLPLALYPAFGRKARQGLPEGLRELVVHPNYIVFYRVLPEHRTVEIVRVKHTSQQVP